MKTLKLLPCLCLLVSAHAVVVDTSADDWILWPTSAGGNGHYYLPVHATTPVSWEDAFTNAEALGGYLATITSAEENAFVFGLINSPEYWFGELGPLLGGYQPPGSPEPAGGWTWVSGEPWDYTNWAGGQPDNGGEPEDCIHFWNGPTWNDKRKSDRSFVGYVVEKSCTPHKARATAEIVNGFVVGATITDPGCGYTNAPLVLILGGSGSGATASAVISNGVVSRIIITDAGVGYDTPPRIVIASPPFVPTLDITVSKVKVAQHIVLGRRYQLQSSSNMVDWVAVAAPFTALSESIEDEFDVNATGGFFRIREVP